MPDLSQYITPQIHSSEELQEYQIVMRRRKQLIDYVNQLQQQQAQQGQPSSLDQQIDQKLNKLRSNQQNPTSVIGGQLREGLQTIPSQVIPQQIFSLGLGPIGARQFTNTKRLFNRKVPALPKASMKEILHDTQKPFVMNTAWTQSDVQMRDQANRAGTWKQQNWDRIRQQMKEDPTLLDQPDTWVYSQLNNDPEKSKVSRIQRTQLTSVGQGLLGGVQSNYQQAKMFNPWTKRLPGRPQTANANFKQDMSHLYQSQPKTTLPPDQGPIRKGIQRAGGFLSNPMFFQGILPAAFGVMQGVHEVNTPLTPRGY